MKFSVLATDFDGTIAHDGIVDAETFEALGSARRDGVRLILVTGRDLTSLFRTFDGTDIFELIVAENGAVMYGPSTGRIECLGDPPPPALLDRLQNEGVPISTGQSIVATVLPHEGAMQTAIAALRLNWHIIRNKDAVMALPRGVTKATGLAHALRALPADARETVGVGDAENDTAMFAMCGLSVAVANALPELKAVADLVTRGARGAGVRELLARWRELPVAAGSRARD